jgi:hypothetical protein
MVLKIIFYIFSHQVMGVLSVYATSLSYVNFIILLYCYMFRSYDHLQVGRMTETCSSIVV